ncbi:MAG: hypothetical protein ACI965_002463 [Paraglaciecola sp.]|jgi:hypothetical protein
MIYDEVFALDKGTAKQANHGLVARSHYFI